MILPESIAVTGVGRGRGPAFERGLGQCTRASLRATTTKVTWADPRTTMKTTKAGNWAGARATMVKGARAGLRETTTTVPEACPEEQDIKLLVAQNFQ